MTTTAALHIATVRQYNPLTGVAKVVIPALYGDVPVEARPFLTSPAEAANLPLLDPGDTVAAFYDGGSPMAVLRWYLTGGHGAGATAGSGADEVWVSSTAPTNPNIELWYDTDAPTTTVPGLIPAGGAVGQVVGKTGVLDHDVGWVADQTGAPVRRPVVAQTGTTYTPVAADENTMITLSNAAVITVTLPSNATQAIPVNAEIDFVWWGVGQPTFAQGAGATVVGTPGLKLRARYSAATAKKMATNDWLIIGDLSA